MQSIREPITNIEIFECHHSENIMRFFPTGYGRAHLRKFPSTNLKCTNILDSVMLLWNDMRFFFLGGEDSIVSSDNYNRKYDIINKFCREMSVYFSNKVKKPYMMQYIIKNVVHGVGLKNIPNQNLVKFVEDLLFEFFLKTIGVLSEYSVKEVHKLVGEYIEELFEGSGFEPIGDTKIRHWDQRHLHLLNKFSSKCLSVGWGVNGYEAAREVLRIYRIIQSVKDSLFTAINEQSTPSNSCLLQARDSFFLEVNQFSEEIGLDKKDLQRTVWDLFASSFFPSFGSFFFDGIVFAAKSEENRVRLDDWMKNSSVVDFFDTEEFFATILKKVVVRKYGVRALKRVSNYFECNSQFFFNLALQRAKQDVEPLVIMSLSCSNAASKSQEESTEKQQYKSAVNVDSFVQAHSTFEGESSELLCLPSSDGLEHKFGSSLSDLSEICYQKFNEELEKEKSSGQAHSTFEGESSELLCLPSSDGLEHKFGSSLSDLSEICYQKFEEELEKEKSSLVGDPVEKVHNYLNKKITNVQAHSTFEGESSELLCLPSSDGLEHKFGSSLSDLSEICYQKFEEDLEKNKKITNSAESYTDLLGVSNTLGGNFAPSDNLAGSLNRQCYKRKANSSLEEGLESGKGVYTRGQRPENSLSNLKITIIDLSGKSLEGVSKYF